MIKQYREKSVVELQKLVHEWKSQLLALRFQQTSGQLQKTHQFQNLRTSIARALTVIAQKQASEPQPQPVIKEKKAPAKQKEVKEPKKESTPKVKVAKPKKGDSK